MNLKLTSPRLGFLLGVAVFTPLSLFAAVVVCDGTDATPCTINQLYKSIYNMYILISTLAFMLAVVNLARVGIMNYPYDKPEALSKLWKQVFNVIVWGAVLFAIIPLSIMFLRSLGVENEYLQPLLQLKNSSFLIQHAYAEGLPTPVNFDNPYDFFLMLLGAFYRWAVIPCVIGMWVYAGILFVSAQGVPAQITKAKHTLWYSFIFTAILLLLQTVMIALRATIGAMAP